MALPTFVAAGTPAAGTGAIVVGQPAGAQADDILVLGVETNSSQPATAPTGWTEFPDSPQDCGGAGSACLAAFWKRHDGSETDPTVADTGNHQIAAIIAVRGCVATGDPFDVTAGNVLNLGSTSTTITIPGDTTTVADCLIVAIGAHDIDAAGEQISGWANADLANVLERVDAGTDAGGGGGFGIATGEKATAGAFGATTATIGSATEQCRIMVALKPPAGGGTEHFGAASLELTDSIVAAGKKDAKAAASAPSTVNVAATAKKDAHAATDLGLSASVAIAGKKNANATFTVPLTFGIAVSGETGGAVSGAASLEATFGATTTGKRTAHAAAALALSVSVATQGMLTRKGATALDLILGTETSGQRGAYGAATLPLAFTFATSGLIGALPIVTAHFDQPNPAGGFDPGTANLDGGADPGSPGGAHYDQPTPRQVLA